MTSPLFTVVPYYMPVTCRELVCIAVTVVIADPATLQSERCYHFYFVNEQLGTYLDLRPHNRTTHTAIF